MFGVTRQCKEQCDYRGLALTSWGRFLLHSAPLTFWQLSPCALGASVTLRHRESGARGICAPRLGRGRKSSATGVGWAYTDAMQPQRELKIRRASSAGASSASRQQGRQRAPRASLAGARPVDWGKWLSLSAQRSLNHIQSSASASSGQPRGWLQGCAARDGGGDGQDFQCECCWPETRSLFTGGSVWQWESREFPVPGAFPLDKAWAWLHTRPALSGRRGWRPRRGLSGRILWLELISRFTEVELVEFLSSDVEVFMQQFKS